METYQIQHSPSNNTLRQIRNAIADLAQCAFLEIAQKCVQFTALAGMDFP